MPAVITIQTVATTGAVERYFKRLLLIALLLGASGITSGKNGSAMKKSCRSEPFA